MRRKQVRPPAPLLAGIALSAMASVGLAQAPQVVHERLDTTTPITYFIADSAGIRGARDSDRQLAVWALQAWERAGGGAFKFEESPQSTARVRVYWAGSRAGEYGETRWMLVGGRRGASVFVRPDTDALGGDIAARVAEDALFRDAIVHLTCVHEIGHALGLEHTGDFRDIMYSFGYGGDIVAYFDRYRRQLKSRNDIATTSAFSEADVAHLKALYTKQ